MNTSWESHTATNTSLVVTVCPDNAMESSLWICIFGELFFPYIPFVFLSSFLTTTMQAPA